MQSSFDLRRYSLKRPRQPKVSFSQNDNIKSLTQPGRTITNKPHIPKVYDEMDNQKIQDSGIGATYLNHLDIKQQAIQIFHTEERERNINERNEAKHSFLRVIHPNDRFRRTFDFVTVLWVLMLVFTIPFEIGFDWYKINTFQKALSTILDIWFTVDILLNFRTGYIYHGTVVMNPKKIVSYYLTTWFLIDLLGTFPFEKFIQSEANSRKSLKLIKYFKIPKLLRISRVMKYVRDHKHVYDIFQVFSLVFTLLHIGACLWMLLLDPCNIDSDNYAGSDICAQENIYNLYAEAIHITAVMMLGISNSHIIGSPDTLDIMVERNADNKIRIYIFSTMYMVGGLFLIALLMSEMNVYLIGKMQGSAAFQQRSDRVKHEMEYYGVPDDLRLQVRAFYDYVWIHQRQYDDKIALLSDEQMSTDLQRKLALHLFKDVVSHISFFSEVDDLLLGEICLSLRTRIFLPNDMILFKGDVGKELFIIAKGIVEVLRDDLPVNKRYRSPPILLKSGSFFGEIALVMEVRRTCSVQARTICEVNILQQRTFDAILLGNPDFARRMNELVVARQLETCLARSVQQGVDFQVAQSDLDLAVEAMEQNMKEGLDRRKAMQNRTHYVPESRISQINQYSTLEQHDSESTKEDLLRTAVASESLARKSPTIPPPFIGSEIAKSSKSKTTDVMPDVIEEQNGTTANRSSDVSMMIGDIARRSTRFVAEAVRRPPRIQTTQHIDDLSDDSSESFDACSDGEVKTPSQNNRRGQRTESLPCIHTRNAENGKENKEEVDVAGHFRPGKTVVDIQKVHPSILNTGRDNSLHREEDMIRLNARMSFQDKMMEKLLSKLEVFEAKEMIKTSESRNKQGRHKHREKPKFKDWSSA
mmetsp:Transcript_23451/g.34585  ORF Transcript_23451/g.34585 Transcript_23451/m.34585 type:complete len:870 (-) Transcript_23451:1888-4497(-)